MSKAENIDGLEKTTVTVTAPTNIAVIKYWGKMNKELNTPINSSVSVTLDQDDLRAITTACASPLFESDRLWLNGTEEDVTERERFNTCVREVKKLAQTRTDPVTGAVVVCKEDWDRYKVHVVSRNTFPTAAGLASSAAGYAALVAALAKLFNAAETYPGELSAIARQGSGSACRSLYGGFVRWQMGVRPDAKDSHAVQVADERHWNELRAVICVVSDSKKDTSSTSGMMTSVKTSSLLAYRAEHVVPQRLEQIERAYMERDFETFGTITMKDSNQFHATCLDTYPPIFYMNDTSRSIVHVITAYNAYYGHVRAAYTFDAGPNAVIYTLEEHVLEVLAILLRFYAPETLDSLPYTNKPELQTQASIFPIAPQLLAAVSGSGQSRNGEVKFIYCTKPGPGPIELDSSEHLIDITTGFPKELKIPGASGTTLRQNVKGILNDCKSLMPFVSVAAVSALVSGFITMRMTR